MYNEKRKTWSGRSVVCNHFSTRLIGLEIKVGLITSAYSLLFYHAGTLFLIPFISNFSHSQYYDSHIVSYRVYL